jgi:tetratricopeptide (TPR) repeat protein
VELEPAILRVARDCSPVNHDVLANPRVRIHIGDAREWLLTSRDRYDIIFSEPSNPYRAGISSLFTADFYRAARSRLAPGGIFLQWLQAYEVDSGTVLTVYATLGSVFPEVETWHTKQSDLVLAATNEPIAYDGARLRERLRQEPYLSALRDAWRVSDLEGFLSHFVARSSLTRTLVSSARTPLNTDDTNVVEFAFARSLGHDTFFDVEELRRAARSSQADRPVVAGDVDWGAVDRWRVSAATSQGRAPAAAAGMTVDELRQSLAQKSFIEARPEAVLANWRAQAWEPRGSIEEIVLAEALAQGGEDLAGDYIERIRQRSGVEADVLLARLRWRQGRLEEATQSLERAFQVYREDPWPLAILVRNSFAVVLDIASRDAAFASRLEESLSRPFALAVLDEERRLVRLEVASRLEASRYVRAVEDLEPDVPWRQPILERRAQAYAATGNSRARLAQRELAAFLEREPPPFMTAEGEAKK